MVASINIRPGVRMLELFASLPYKEWYAIGELVDNAIQSYVANRQRLVELHGPGYVLRIAVEVSQEGTGTIRVSDNAAGISLQDWDRAMRVAVPPDDTRGLSQFGVGMKAAACWFSRRWSVESSALGEHFVRRVTIDVPATVLAENEDIELEEALSSPGTHGTVVTMMDLRRKPWGAGIRRIKDHLASIYRDFLRDGDVVITYNGEAVDYSEQPILLAPHFDTAGGPDIEWRRTFDVELESGRHVRGWLAIRASGKQSAAGLALLYRRKVIVGAGDARYKPEALFGAGNTFRSQRLFGEVDVSDFDVSHTKDSLLWADEEDEVIDALVRVTKEPTLPIFAQAENYRAPRVEVAPTDEVDVTSTRVVAAISKLSSAPREELLGNGTHTALDPAVDEGSDYETTLDTRVDGQLVAVTIRLVRDPMESRWINISEHDSGGALTITLNRSHPFMRKHCELPVKDLEAVWLIGIAIALGARQGQNRGAKLAHLVLEGINDHVRRLAI